MTDPDTCIICLEPLPPPPLEPSIQGAEGDDGGGVGGSGGSGGRGGSGGSGDAAPADGIRNRAKTVSPDDDLDLVVAKKLPANSSNAEDVQQKTTLTQVAKLEGCDHLLHDTCIRAWAEQTNTCPICRTGFNLVHVFDGVNGPHLSSYPVADKKQVADFDIREWLDQNDGLDDEEDATPCPVCNQADQEECLLLCDSCDAAYHTHCIGLSHVPEGHWYCMECEHVFRPDESDAGLDEDTEQDEYLHAPVRNRATVARRTNNSRIFPRTRGRLRRIRQNARSLDWLGQEWGEITRSVYVGLDLDLDNPDGDDNFNHYRRSQQRTNRERREYQRWQQRLNIASRLGAREAFTSAIPRDISAHLTSPPSPAPPQRTAQQEADDRNERRAWMALERAREEVGQSTSSPSRRKRKSRSLTASPRETELEPERKLKRPRTRRLPIQGETPASGSGSGSGAGPTNGFGLRSSATGPERIDGASSTPASGMQSPSAVEAPTFLTSLLKEVEMGTPSDDESVKILISSHRRVPEASSPVSSPSASAYSSPRDLSATPPPPTLTGGRPSSPPLLLSSHIEARYPPANYSPNQSPKHSPKQSPSQSPIRAMTNGISNETSDNERATVTMIHRPRPQRPNGTEKRSAETSSSTGTTLSLDDKNRINSIVRLVLRPHWHAQKLSSEQYAKINRDVSRRLYDEAREMPVMNEDARKVWETMAKQEVAKAMANKKM